MRVYTLLVPALLLIQPASAPGQTGSSDEARQLVQGSPVEREMKGGDTHTYQVQLTAGQFIEMVVDQRGIDVVVRTVAPGGKRLGEVDSPNGAQGPEPISIAAETPGVYQLEVSSFDKSAAPGRYEVRIEELLSAEQYRVRLAEQKARDEAVIARLKSAAIPLKSVTPRSGFDDLKPLKEILRDVRLVGVGEASHGTREFFQVRHRLLEFLVKEMDFTVLAVEASYGAAGRINDYVLHGKGDLAGALASQKTWILDTEEIADVLAWLRTYNQGVPEDRQVRFVGIDPQVNEIAIESVVAYLRRVAPEQIPGLEPTFQKLRLEDDKAVDFAPTAVPAEHLTELYRLISYLVLNRETLVRRTSAAEFDQVLQYVRLLAQFAEFNSPVPVKGGGTRDGYMAENLLQFVHAENPAARVVLWGTQRTHLEAGHRRLSSDGVFLE